MTYRRVDGRGTDSDKVDVNASDAIGRRVPFKPVGGPTRALAPAPKDPDACVKILLHPDAHYPYHDPWACELLLRVAERTKPDVLVVLGDHWDFWQLSDHQRDLKKRADAEAELRSGDEGLRAYDQLGVFKRKIFCQGNHEYRLERYLAREAGDALRMLAPAGLLQVRTMFEALDMRGRGWEWIPYGDYGRIGGLHFTHDLARAGKTAHEHAQGDFETSSAIGHTHHFRMMVRGNVHGRWHTGAMFGWLGDWRQIDYRPKMKVKREWPLGFGMAYVERANDTVHVQPVLIHSDGGSYRALVEGRLYNVPRYGAGKK